MTERPIIMSTPMVEAILEGRKTQTRRVVKPQPTFIESSGRWKWPLPKKYDNDGKCAAVYTGSREWYEYAPKEAFPYQPGDVLWVRETFWNRMPDKQWRGQITYYADCPGLTESGGVKVRWKPSIHMPRWAARLFLRVTDVRVERLQDISEADATAEGVPFTELPQGRTKPDPLHRDQFADLWDSLNAKRGYGWQVNPWVWIIEFERSNNAQR